MAQKIVILIVMIFLHIIDDYYLQGELKLFKQKAWWQANAPEEKYKYDYIIALIMHAFSWAFMIMLPATVYLYSRKNSTIGVVLLLANLIIHAVVDNKKANERTINLIQDQMIHLAQIVLSWLAVFIY